MLTIITLLVFCQVLGACVGAFAAAWGEFAYVRAMRDGKVSVAERAHLHSIAFGLRFGMMLILLSSFGLIVASYMLQSVTQPATSSNFWLLMLFVFLIVWVSWALSRGRITFAFGSAIVFTGWWFLAYLALGWLPNISFGSALAFFVVAVAMFYGILQTMRFLILPKR